MFKLESTKTSPMTREIATRISTLRSVPGERAISIMRTHLLLREIEQGGLTVFRWVTASVKGNNTVYRVNGQHTSRIFTTMMPPCGFVSVDHYVCDTIDDLVNLWSKYDPTFSSRSKVEVLNSSLSIHQELKKLPSRQRSYAVSAAGLKAFGFGYASKVSNHDKARVAIENKDFLIWACSVFHHKSAMCHKTGVYLAALETYLEDKEQASVFWEEVQCGTNTNIQSGSRVLQLFLLEHLGKSRTRNGRRPLSWDQYAELSMSAWRSWLSRSDVKHLRRSKSGVSKFMQLPTRKSMQESF